MRLGHVYQEKSEDLELKKFCIGIELLYSFNIERTTTDGKFPKVKFIFYNKIELNENQYNLLDEFRKEDYLVVASSFELEIYGGLQRLLALKEVAHKRGENTRLNLQNYLIKCIIIVTLIVILFLSYFLFRLRKLNKFIKKEQIIKDRFFALFSHDLRGVITNLKDSGEVLNYLIKNNRLDEIQEVSKQLDYDGCHALLLLNNMLDWGILTGYSYQPTFGNFMLSNKILDIISIFECVVDSKSIKISTEIENDLSIYSDEKSIDVVLRNIIANAKAYTPEGGNISIRLEKQQTNQISFIVTNSLSAFKKHNLEHIQNVFAGKTKPKAGLHGLGLGVVLIHEYAKSCDLNLEFSFEKNIITFKALFGQTNIINV